MKQIQDIDQFNPEKPVVLTIGTFDGVHLGHQKIIQQVKEIASKINGESYLLTFDPHPRKVVAPSEYNEILIQTLEEKANKLAEFGLDYLIVYPFTLGFSKLSAMDFVKNILVNQLHINTLVIGYDHHFGANREGNISFLKEVSQQFNFEVVEIPPQEIDALKISSTRIRQTIQNGQVGEVKKLLGGNYKMQGKIVKGDQIGRTIGFPTANFQTTEDNKIIPNFGVYIVRFVWKNKSYQGVMNIGVRPSVTSSLDVRMEVHLLNFEGDLYGEAVRIEFLEKIRNEKKFANLEELKNQINNDVQIALSYFNAIH